jgi:hypothetical protein
MLRREEEKFMNTIAWLFRWVPPTALSLLLASPGITWADGAVIWGATAGAEVIDAGNDVITSVSVSIPPTTDAPGTLWHCAVTCRAEVVDAGDPGFATLLVLDGGVVVGGSTQSFEMDNLSPLPVSTTVVTTLSGASDPDTLACALTEVGATDISVNDSSMTVVCTDLP